MEQPQIVPLLSKAYLKKIFKGRMNRRNYLIGGILIPLVGFIIISIIYTYALATALNTNSQISGINPQLIMVFLAIIVCILLLIVISLYGIATSTKRFHDLNNSGLFWLLNFVPFVSLLVAVYLCFWPGTEGENSYGAKPEPKISMKAILLKH